MRWKWIVPRLLIAFSIWAFIHWGMDPLLRWTAVSALQSVTGARVDIRRVVTTFFPPSIDIQQTAVASARRRGRNLFEFDRMSLQLENRSLSQRRFVISDGRIENLQFDTWRSDDGQLEKPATPVVEEPSWASEKLKELGDEWLTQLSEQARAQLDPNTLETWRLGSEVYEKWDVRFEDLTDRARDLEPRVRSLSEQFKLAKEGSTVDQIEKYLEVAREADLVLQDARRLQNDLKQMAPEVRTDFESINQARLNDQQMIQQKIALLKPDGRRISQALLGRDVYLRVQEMLTWFELFRSYQSELTQQVQPPRNPGRTWPVLPVSLGPAFHARKLSLSGNMSIDRDLVPWQAVLSDITSDPRLLGKPAVLEASAAGPRPLQLKYTVDATTDVLRSELTAEKLPMKPCMTFNRSMSYSPSPVHCRSRTSCSARNSVTRLRPVSRPPSCISWTEPGLDCWRKPTARLPHNLPDSEPASVRNTTASQRKTSNSSLRCRKSRSCWPRCVPEKLIPEPSFSRCPTQNC